MPYGDPLPDGDRVTRGCWGGFDEGVVTASAFAMRKKERKHGRISVDWVECPHVPDTEQTVEGSANRMRFHNVYPPYAVFRVTEIRRVERSGFSLDVKEFGGPANPCHCGITGFSNTPIDLELQEALARIANRFPVIDAPT